MKKLSPTDFRNIESRLSVLDRKDPKFKQQAQQDFQARYKGYDPKQFDQFLNYVSGDDYVAPKKKLVKPESYKTIPWDKMRKAIEQDRFVFEADGDLLLIPVQNIKYLQITPLPQPLPKDIVIRGASIVG